MNEDIILPLDLHEGERVEMVARTEPSVVAMTDRRLIVLSADRTVLDLPVTGLRRIELDVERGRPVTLVLVPHEPRHEPQVLRVPHEELAVVTTLVGIVADRLRGLD